MKRYPYFIFVFIFISCGTAPSKEPPSFNQLNKPTFNIDSEDEEIEVIEASLNSLKLVLSSLKDSIAIDISKIHQPYWGNLSSMPYAVTDQLYNMQVFYFESSNGIERIDDLLLHISVLPNTNQFGKGKILERLKKLCENINNSNIKISSSVGASKVEREKDFGRDIREINRIVVDCGVSILSKYSN